MPVTTISCSFLGPSNCEKARAPELVVNAARLLSFAVSLRYRCYCCSMSLTAASVTTQLACFRQIWRRHFFSHEKKFSRLIGKDFPSFSTLHQTCFNAYEVSFVTCAISLSIHLYLYRRLTPTRSHNHAIVLGKRCIHSSASLTGLQASIGTVVGLRSG